MIIKLIKNTSINVQKHQKIDKLSTLSKNAFLPVTHFWGVAKSTREKGPFFRWKVPSQKLQKGGLSY